MANHKGNGLVSIVVPLHCESTGVSAFLSGIDRVFAARDEAYEVVLVDDGSTDDTWEIIAEEAARRHNVRGLRLSRNFGKESALCAGLDAAIGDAVFVMDGDLQHPPDLMPEMLRLWADGYDVVDAVKSDRGKESFAYRFMTRVFYRLLRLLTGYDLGNASDFKLLDRKVVDAWTRLQEKALFFRGMIAWLGFRHATVSFVVPERQNGHSRWSFFRLVHLAATAITAFSTSALQIISVIGGLFMLFACLLAAQTLYRYMAGTAVSGFTTVILLQLIIGSLLMISLGIVGGYMARIYSEVKARPRYFVDELAGMPVSRESSVRLSAAQGARVPRR
jgi:glycosyltransferase involved in cell wall biosynthesis